MSRDNKRAELKLLGVAVLLVGALVLLYVALT